MKTHAESTVQATRLVDCPFSAVMEYAQEALRRRPDIAIAPAAAPVKESVRIAVRVSDDVSDQVRRHEALLLAWRPNASRLFPAFHGALTVRPKGRGAWLRLQGSYEPPLGGAGRAFDVLLGRTMAKRTLARLLAEIAQSVESQWQAFRAGRTV